jgi:phospholipid/cholesterol/gamma-HCH transport system substrate-binding protein
MGQAIRKHLRDFIAVAVLLVVALVTTYVIVQEQRLRIPVLEEKPFELKAEFETAQAVVPGQGQTITVAGVRIGDVQTVELEDGVGVVTFAVDREFLPIYKDATILMRPRTGLKDMFFQLDPGTRAAGEYEEGGVVPVSNTAPDVNLDEILEALDADTQAYLRLLLVGAGKGLEGRDKDLGKLLGSLGPINRDLAKLNRLVAQRRTNLSRLIHNLNVLTNRIGENDDDLAELVTTSNTALGAIAEQDPSVQRAVRLLPGTLSQARSTLTEVSDFAAALGPAFNDLRPFARNLDELNASTRKLAREATPDLKREVRPFVRAASKPLPDLRKAANRYSRTAPRLTRIGRHANRLLNMAAWNPNGAEESGTPGRNEGFLYWISWLNHNATTVWSAGDGTGYMRRLYLTMGCEQVASLISAPGGGAVPPELGVVLESVLQALTGFTDPTLNALGCPAP